MLRLIITEPAKADIHAAFVWWRDHRDPRQAERWYRDVYAKMLTLEQNPLRYPKAPEYDLLPEGVRQLNFGIGSRPTHRILFTVADDVVTVLRVRHVAQADLTADDLT
jgi:plasmid stabilization system protein ParE